MEFNNSNNNDEVFEGPHAQAAVELNNSNNNDEVFEGPHAQAAVDLNNSNNNDEIFEGPHAQAVVELNNSNNNDEVFEEPHAQAAVELNNSNNNDEVFEGPHGPYLNLISRCLPQNELLNLCTAHSIPLHPQLGDLRAMLEVTSLDAYLLLFGYVIDHELKAWQALESRHVATEATSSEATPSEATPSEATSSKATSSEATSSKANPSKHEISQADPEKDNGKAVASEEVYVNVALQSYCLEQVKKIQDLKGSLDEGFGDDFLRLDAIITGIIAKKKSLVGERSLLRSIPIVDFSTLVVELKLLLSDMEDNTWLSDIIQQEYQIDFRFDQPTAWTETSVAEAFNKANQAMNSIDILLPRSELQQLKDDKVCPELFGKLLYERRMIYIHINSFKCEVEVVEGRQKFRRYLESHSSVSEYLLECPDDICGICCEDLTEDKELRILSCCQHLFCSACWQFMLEMNEGHHRCPICRGATMDTTTSTYLKQYYSERRGETSSTPNVE